MLPKSIASQTRAGDSRNQPSLSGLAHEKTAVSALKLTRRASVGGPPPGGRLHSDERRCSKPHLLEYLPGQETGLLDA